MANGNNGGGERRVGQWLLLFGAFAFTAVFLVVPLAAVFYEAFAKGWQTYVSSIQETEALAAIRLTVLVTALVLPLNVLFGLAAAWAIAMFEFRGKNVLITIIDLPLAISPVVSGFMFVLLFGLQGWFGPWLNGRDTRIIFAVPGIVLATVFVTSPFVARELIPFMQSRGSEEEQAAIVLGASGYQTFWRVTLPKIKWSLLYGIILCSARCMGEFGAVSVVSGHIRGETNTMPLEIEVLYNDYNYSAAFAVASLLSLVGVFTLVLKKLVEWKAAYRRGAVH